MKPKAKLSQIRNWLNKARRAPSAHNTQPAQWFVSDKQEIYLLENKSRHLKVADPQRNDHLLALGAAYEGLSLAASEDNILLSEPEFGIEFPGVLHEELHAHALTRVVGSTATDSLASVVNKRFTYRGEFLKLTRQREEELMRWVEQEPKLRLIIEEDKIAAVADMYDRCALDFCSKPDYYQELYNWLRFTPRHSAWDRDGLNAEAMSMGKLEQKFAAYVAHPKMFKLWVKLGIAKYFISEKSAILSSSCLIVLTCKETLSPFDVGRLFYRTWLQLTAMGILICPMSSISDHENGRKYLQQLSSVPLGDKIVNVFRAGRSSLLAPKLSSRIPLDELLL